MVLFPEMVKTQGEAFVGAGEIVSILEGLNSTSLLDMQMGFFSSYLWKEEGTEDKDAKKKSSARGENPGECVILEAKCRKLSTGPNAEHCWAQSASKSKL